MTPNELFWQALLDEDGAQVDAQLQAGADVHCKQPLS